MTRYEYLRPFAQTPAQNRVLDAALRCDFMQDVGPFLGIANRTAEITMARMRSRAALQGVSPDNDMTHEVPAPFTVKGTSTLYNKDGDISAQWVKTQVNENEKLQLIHVLP